VSDSIEDGVRRELERLGLEYEAMPCDPDFADTAAFCARYHVAPTDSANTIIVVGKSEPRRYVACVVLATHRLDVNGRIRRELGVKKASFASADETRELTGMLIGGVTPFALGDLPVWVDEAVLGRERVVVGGGSRSLKIRIEPAALVKAGARVVTDLALPIE
jgi:prolyl-tRNA editing enzyme YbaK/EbsC (Cys-tRNA(Pro) deacylase)